jgi:hypothetical protein
MSKAPGTALTREDLTRRLLGHVLRQSKMVLADLRNIPRYTFHALAALLLVCGLVCLWASQGDGPIPGMTPLFGLDPYRISAAACTEGGTPATVRWKGLAPALTILEQVNPAVAAWVRGKHDQGLIVFGDDEQTKCDPKAALAKYDVLRHGIVINRELLCENDGTIAVILCHEYRHSRQNLGKFGQYVLSFLFAREGDLSLIENDAMIYEHEAHDAVFGNGRSPEKELAAWQQAQLRDPSGRH